LSRRSSGAITGTAAAASTVPPVISADQRTEVCKAKFSDGTFYFKFATVACWKTLS